MGKSKSLCFAEPDAVDYAGVVERITDDGVALIEQHLEQTPVRIKTGAIENGVLRVKKGADRLLEVLMDSVCSTDKTHGCHTIAVLFEAAGSSFDDAGMIGETQVIVGTEVQDPALYDLNLCLLRAQELSFGLIEPFGSNVG